MPIRGILIIRQVKILSHQADWNNLRPMIRRCLISLLMSSAILTSCDQTNRMDQNAVYARTVFKPEYAQGFEIQQSGEGIQIIFFNPDNYKDTLRVLELLPGSSLNCSCISTTNLSFLKELGILENVSGVCYADMLEDEEVQKLVDSGKILNLTSGEELDSEKLISANADILFSYPFTDFQIPSQFKGMDIPIYEYRENHPLGRSEWIKLFGFIFQQETIADSIFSIAENEYHKSKSLVQKTASSSFPTIMMGSYDGTTWYAPAGNSFLSALIADAAAEYCFRDSISEGNIFLSDESLIAALQNVDYWGELVFGSATKCDQLLGQNDRYIKTKPVQNGHLFYCNTSQQDYFGKATIYPHLLLNDLISILHPDILKDHQRVFYQSCSLRKQ